MGGDGSDEKWRLVKRGDDIDGLETLRDGGVYMGVSVLPG